MPSDKEAREVVSGCGFDDDDVDDDDDDYDDDDAVMEMVIAR